MLSKIQKFVPRPMLRGYHFALALLAHWWYGRPAQKMIIIGVTGTNGKSTTVRLIAEFLAAQGKTAGFISTAEIQIGSKRYLNNSKMTMPGRFTLHRLLRQMLDAGCEYAIVETSSQGVEQHRHIGIAYDVGVITNLAPEHIEAHGGFDNYRAAKGKFFSAVSQTRRKIKAGQAVPKTLIVNLDDPHAAYFLQFPADRKIGFTVEASYDIKGVEEWRAKKVALSDQGASFDFLGVTFNTNLLGLHNVYNAVCALACGHALGFELTHSSDIFLHLRVPGRMEFVDEGQAFKVLVDYAPEPQSLSKLYQTLKLITKQRVIHVLGSCGGGRDRARRKVLGRMAGRTADVVVVTNEDPYDDDPMEIINEVAEGAREQGKTDGRDLFAILDRRQAIARAIALAQPGDLVVLTGKGSEQAMVVKHNQKIPWDDRTVAREELKKLSVR